MPPAVSEDSLVAYATRWKPRAMQMPVLVPGERLLQQSAAAYSNRG
jgi:hypothetical protein